MHHHATMYNNVCTHHPLLPYRHHGLNVCSSYDVAEPISMATMNCCASPHCHDYACRRDVSYVDYSYNNCVPRVMPPPINLTNVRNDIRYIVDDPAVMYDDEHGETYRLSRSKIQLVDLLPKHTIKTNSNRLYVSRNTSTKPLERVIVPRSTVLRHTSLPIYERRIPVRLVPLYHSADPQYIVPNRRSMPTKLIPLATVHHPTKRTIKVRSLSP